MTRKPLPKAIRQTSDDLRGITAGIVPDEEAPLSASSLNRIEAAAAPAVASPPITGELILPASTHADSQAASLRRSAARKIVERHKTYAAVSGLFPLPIVNVAGVTALILRMVKQLSDLYGVPFERDWTRSVVIGIIGGAVPTGFGAAAASTLAFAVPGGALVGLAVSAITAGALTRGIGLVFIEHFENGAMPLGFAEPEPA